MSYVDDRVIDMCSGAAGTPDHGSPSNSIVAQWRRIPHRAPTLSPQALRVAIERWDSLGGGKNKT
ncbi:hypothetical protein Asp14428_32430 [Actinoplanes sp. NBRC 14428]|nr:hypothetical protein Asp14428_32430 [Actinoplanes sp. NBRC 14428]